MTWSPWLHRGDARADLDDDARALVPEDDREQALGVCARAGELVGVADARRLDLDQHLARPSAPRARPPRSPAAFPPRRRRRRGSSSKTSAGSSARGSLHEGVPPRRRPSVRAGSMIAPMHNLLRLFGSLVLAGSLLGCGNRAWPAGALKYNCIVGGCDHDVVMTPTRYDDGTFVCPSGSVAQTSWRRGCIGLIDHRAARAATVVDQADATAAARLRDSRSGRPRCRRCKPRRRRRRGHTLRRCTRTRAPVQLEALLPHPSKRRRAPTTRTSSLS